MGRKSDNKAARIKLYMYMEENLQATTRCYVAVAVVHDDDDDDNDNDDDDDGCDVLIIAFMQCICTYIPESTTSLDNTVLQLFCSSYSWCI